VNDDFGDKMQMKYSVGNSGSEECHEASKTVIRPKSLIVLCESGNYKYIYFLSSILLSNFRCRRKISCIYFRALWL